MQNPESTKPPELTSANGLKAYGQSLGISALLGTLFGSIAGGIAYPLGGSKAAEGWFLGTGGLFFAGGLGATLGYRSIEAAVNHRNQGHKWRARWKFFEAMAEGTLGYGAGGAIAGLESDGLTRATVAGILTGALGGAGAYFIYRDLTKPLPDLTIPNGNSIEQRTEFPKFLDGTPLPSVYTVNSLDEFLEFREINKERLVKWSRSTPNESSSAHSLSNRPFSDAIAIISDKVQHYPALDPNQDKQTDHMSPATGMDMKLFSGTNYVVVHPDRSSFMLWPYQTIFEDMVMNNRTFNPERWHYWKDKSWKHSVILLAQYQQKGVALSSAVFSMRDREVVDNYWLLDIIANEGGVRKKVKQPKFEPKTVPTFNPIHPTVL